MKKIKTVGSRWLKTTTIPLIPTNNIDLPDRKVFEKAELNLKYSDLEVENGPNGRRYITPEGHSYPSITTVLGSFGKQAIYEWRKRVGAEEANRISRHATTRGQALHTLMEKYVRGDEVVLTGNEMPHVRLSFSGACKVINQHLTKVYVQEYPLYSDHLELAGRVDLIGEFSRRMSIIDFKTSSRIKSREDIEDYFIQECAYAIMFEERTGISVPRLVTIMTVDNDSAPVVFVERRVNWEKALLNKLKDYRTNLLFGKTNT